MNYTKYLSYPPSLLFNSNDYPFLNSRISVNYDKVDGPSANDEILIKKEIVSLCRISFGAIFLSALLIF